MIDPSKADFSKFLSLVRTDRADIKLAGDYCPNLKDHYKAFYSKGKIPEGRKQNESRDCIDIAVKISFKLNELQQNTNDINGILKDLHRSMSSSKEVKDFKAPSLRLMRDAHSSKSDTRKSFEYLLKTIDVLKDMHEDSYKPAFNHQLYK